MEEDIKEKKQIIRLMTALVMLGLATVVLWVIGTIHYSHHDSIPSSILHTTPITFVSDLHNIFGVLGAISILTSDLIVIVWVSLIAASLYVSLYAMNKKGQNARVAKRLLIVALVSVSILAFDLTMFAIEKHREKVAAAEISYLETL
jgi:hypothetical protein